VYWLKHLEPYDYFIRIDEDSMVTSTLQTNFVDVLHEQVKTMVYITSTIEISART
jgi:hypothetical protein